MPVSKPVLGEDGVDPSRGRLRNDVASPQAAVWNGGSEGRVGVTPEPLRSAVVFDHSQLWLHSCSHLSCRRSIGGVCQDDLGPRAIELVQEPVQLLVTGIDNGSDSMTRLRRTGARPSDRFR
jgi:hypothetical protein